MNSRPACSTEWISGQPRLHREALSKSKTKNKQKNNKKDKHQNLNGKAYFFCGEGHMYRMTFMPFLDK